MKYLLDRNKMQQIDSCAIHTIGIPSLVLMERAALAAANVIKEKADKKAAILAVCGTGNNGGDGVAVARILKEWNFDVSIFFAGNEESASEETKIQLAIARKTDIKILNNTEIKEYNIIVDALFGIGLNREIQGMYGALIKEMNESGKRIFSIDIPSGVHSGTGKIMKIAVKAEETITFGWNKTGMVLYPGCEYAGNITVADIGFPQKVIEFVGTTAFSYTKEDLRNLPIRNPHSNKGSYGKILVIAGSYNMSGACYFSAKAAYASGAGLVKIVTVEENRTVLQEQLPEALLFTYQSGKVTEEKEAIKELIQWATAIVIGPGIGMSEDAKKLLYDILTMAEVPVVIDADGINCLKEVYERIPSAERNKKSTSNFTTGQLGLGFPENFILTPHIKEMSRLGGETIEEISKDIIGTAKAAVGFSEDVKSKEAFTLVLKDARTVVTNGKELYINQSGNNGMATAGSGDVLTGIIAAFAAQGLSCFQAACLGVYVHGLAGDYSIKEKGHYGLMASDIIEGLYQVWRDYELSYSSKKELE